MTFFLFEGYICILWITCIIIQFFWFTQVLKPRSFVYDATWWCIRYLRRKCFFQSMLFLTACKCMLRDICWRDDSQQGIESYHMFWYSISKQLKSITSAAYSMKAALNNVSWILSLASRQNFVWSQYWK